MLHGSRKHQRHVLKFLDRKPGDARGGWRFLRRRHAVVTVGRSAEMIVCERNVVPRQRAGRLPRIRKSTDASWKPLARYAVWLAPPHYGQRSRANVACVTYHDLVMTCARFHRSRKSVRLRMCIFGWQELQIVLIASDAVGPACASALKASRWLWFRDGSDQQGSVDGGLGVVQRADRCRRFVAEATTRRLLRWASHGGIDNEQ